VLYQLLKLLARPDCAVERTYHHEKRLHPLRRRSNSTNDNNQPTRFPQQKFPQKSPTTTPAVHNTTFLLFFSANKWHSLCIKMILLPSLVLFSAHNASNPCASQLNMKTVERLFVKIV
jgi:hypothetical protein